MKSNGNTSSSLSADYTETTDDGFLIEIFFVADDTVIYIDLPATIPAEWEEHGVTPWQSIEYVVEKLELHDAVIMAHGLADEARARLATFSTVVEAFDAAKRARDEAKRVLAEAERVLDDARWDVQEARP